MKNWKRNIILFAWICLITESFGQTSSPYTLLTKFQKNPYDTGVAIQISEYRHVRFKVTFADSLISALHVEINKSLETIVEQEKSTRILVSVVARHMDTIDKKDKTISDISHKFDALETECNKPPPFFKKPVVLFVFGVVTGSAFFYRRSW